MAKEAENGEHSEATGISLDWLHNKISRLTGHAALTLGGEFFIGTGSILLPFGISTSVITGNPIPALLASIPTIIGTTIGWQGVKHAQTQFEKAVYIGIKAFATVAHSLAPAWANPAFWLSAASTAIGLRNRR